MVALGFAGVGLLAYLIAWIIMPDTLPGEPEPTVPAEDRRTMSVIIGAALIGLGGLLVFAQAMPGFHHTLIWPLLVVAAGVAVLASSRR